MGKKIVIDEDIINDLIKKIEELEKNYNPIILMETKRGIINTTECDVGVYKIHGQKYIKLLSRENSI
tara:strand:+ start:107 stop:307 length:201 start_codon:yes stop_codon:yes gene_type:complete